MSGWEYALISSKAVFWNVFIVGVFLFVCFPLNIDWGILFETFGLGILFLPIFSRVPPLAAASDSYIPLSIGLESRSCCVTGLDTPVAVSTAVPTTLAIFSNPDTPSNAIFIISWDNSSANLTIFFETIISNGESSVVLANFIIITLPTPGFIAVKSGLNASPAEITLSNPPKLGLASGRRCSIGVLDISNGQSSLWEMISSCSKPFTLLIILINSVGENITPFIADIFKNIANIFGTGM